MAHCQVVSNASCEFFFTFLEKINCILPDLLEGCDLQTEEAAGSGYGASNKPVRANLL